MRIIISLLLVFTSTILLSQNINEGLVAHYTFNGNTDDISGNGNHGTNMGAVLTQDRFGITNRAYHFNGIDAYITIPSSASLESPDTAITMSAWINPISFSLVGDDFAPILMKSDNPSNIFMYRMAIYESGVASALNNWNNSTVSVADIPMNEWHHLAVTYCSSYVKYYYNDELISEELFDCNIAPNDLPLEIGRDVPGITEFFNGAIDDIRIYDRCLSAEEIIMIFGEGASSISSIETNEFSLSPNPATNQVTVQSKKQNLFQHIQLVDMLGRVVEEQRFSPTNTKTLDLSGLKKGLYNLLILDDQSVVSSPLMIK